MNIKWTDRITNEGLWRITHQKAIESQIKRRKWSYSIITPSTAHICAVVGVITE